MGRWPAGARGGSPDDLIIDRTDLDSARFLVLGDTGEGDESQFALVPPLLESGKDTHFMVICSVVIYPAGEVNEYLKKFYCPYKDYRNLSTPCLEITTGTTGSTALWSIFVGLSLRSVPLVGTGSSGACGARRRESDPKCSTDAASFGPNSRGL